MFYILKDNVVEKAEIIDIKGEVVHIGYLTLEELKEQHETLGINQTIVANCEKDQTHFETGVDTYEDFSFGMIHIINVMNIHEARDKVAFILRKNQFILVKLEDKDDSLKVVLENTIERFKHNATLGKVIFGILESLLLHGNKPLEKTERIMIHMEQKLVNNEINEHLNQDIFRLRKDLSILKNYYEHLVDIAEELYENKNNLVAEGDLKYFHIFTNKADRLSRNTQLLSEDLIHLREALDASLNYTLNKIMKLFTVVTTIFLPLTLIVGWYGMNFTNMPELTWKYGYLTVSIFCILILVGSLVYFRKKKYF